ncbi:SRPBCC family protein [Flavobacterium sp. 3HN19-14]|uniref:SRPBCC family protein n=1 Tax=Flavobacterium sp. 3HN19-14 TaxID=3448133 RepID=UPI003EDF1E2E
MHTFYSILGVIAGIIILLLLLALFMRKKHFVKREIIIDAPVGKIFAYLRFLENQDKFNRHAMAGGEREKTFTGTDGTVGFIYAWHGDKKAGEGEKEIKNIIENKLIETEIRFVKPMKATAAIVMETESLSDGQTKVSWSNSGTLPYPVNIMIPMMEKMLPKDMDASLAMLKGILEK